MKDDGHRWVRVSRGFYLLGFGTFLLLTTQNLLPAMFWAEAAACWPVLLVAIGIRLVFERGPLPWLVLLGPLLVIGTLLYVSLRPAGAGTQADWTTLRVERPAGANGWTLDARLGLADLEVRSKRLPRNLLAEARTTEAGRHSVRVEPAKDGRVLVTNSAWKKSFFTLPGRRPARCVLETAAGLPVALSLDLAFTSTRIDLSATPLTRLSIDGGFNDLTLRLAPPATDVRLELEGAFNQIDIAVPAGTPVKVTTDGVLNVVDRGGVAGGADAGAAGGSAGGASGGAAGGAAGSAPGYRLVLDGAFNRVVLVTR